MLLSCCRSGDDAPTPPQPTWTNFDGSLQYHVPVWRPSHTEQLPAERPLLIVGAGHSWQPEQKNIRAIVSSEKLKAPPLLLEDGKLVQVGAGVTLGELLTFLEAHQLSLATFPYHSAITVGGAVATAAHGTSFQQGTISDSVVALDMEPDFGIPLELLSASVGKLGLIKRVVLQTTPLERLSKQLTIVDFDIFIASMPELKASTSRLEAWYDPETHQVLIVSYHKNDQRAASIEPSSAPSVKLQEIAQLVSLPESGTPAELFFADNDDSRLEAEYAIAHSKLELVLAGLRHWLEKERIALRRPIIVRFGGIDRLPLLSPARHEEGTAFINIDLTTGQHKEAAAIEGFLIESYAAKPHLGKFHSGDQRLLEAAYGESYQQFHEQQPAELQQLFGPIHSNTGTP